MIRAHIGTGQSDSYSAHIYTRIKTENLRIILQLAFLVCTTWRWLSSHLTWWDLRCSQWCWGPSI